MVGKTGAKEHENVWISTKINKLKSPNLQTSRVKKGCLCWGTWGRVYSLGYHIFDFFCKISTPTQLLAGFDKEKIVYYKKEAPQTKEECVQLCCNVQSCHIVFMYMDNEQLTCFHVS